MGTRIRGAVLAFAAALLVALSVPMAWWSGPPTMGTKVVKEMQVDIGLLSFEGCRGVGGNEVQCQKESHTDARASLRPSMGFAIAGFATLASALLAAALLVLQGFAGATGRQALRRKVAIGALIASAFVGACGAVFVLLAPDVHAVPKGAGPFLAFGGAVLGIIQAVLAMRPDRVQMPKPAKVKAPRAAKPPKPAKVKAPKPTRAPALPPISPAPAPPPGGYPPIDFLALMEADEDAQAQETVPKVPAMPWGGPHHQAAPSNALPGPAAVLGTSMPSAYVGGGNGGPMGGPIGGQSGPIGVPMTGPNAPTMFPHQMAAPPPPPPPPPPAMGPFPPSAPPYAPTQAIVPVPSWVPPNPLPSSPMVMNIAQTPLPGTLPAMTPPPSAAEAPTQQPTAIPVPPLAAQAPTPLMPEPMRTGGDSAPPPFRKSGQTLPPPIQGAAPPPMRTKAPSLSPVIPAAAQAALAKPPVAALDGDSRAATTELGDRTDATAAVPEGAEPTDMGPLVDPPIPDDLDGRFDTASDMMETIERSGSEAEAMRAGIKPRVETPPPFKTVDRSLDDETRPRERQSAQEIVTSAPKTPTPKPITPKPTTQPPTMRSSAPPPPTPPRPKPASTPPPEIPISTASPDLPPPTDAQVATDGPAPACPQCDAPMTWVEKHLRFYCGTCRMYF